MWVLWLAVSLIGTWLVVALLFVAVSHAKALVEAGEKFSWFWKVPLYVGLLLGLVLDFAFNVTFGSAMFAEPPKELLFTSRVKRHARTSEGWRKRAGIKWAADLNKFDPGHVKL